MFKDRVSLRQIRHSNQHVKLKRNGYVVHVTIVPIDMSACGGLENTPNVKKLRSRKLEECVSNNTEMLIVPGTRHTDRKVLSSGTTGNKICT